MPNEAIMTHHLSSESEDTHLIARFATGEEAAFEALFRKYQHRFQIVCQNYLNDRSEAEDVVQETFLDIYHGLHRFRHEASFQTWSYRILLRKCSERQRRRVTGPPIDASLETLHALPAPDTLCPLDAITVQEALQELPENVRRVLILKYYEQLSGQEIAQMLDCNEGQIKMRVRRAKDTLKGLLEKAFGTQAGGDR